MPEQVSVVYDPDARVFNVTVDTSALPQGGNEGDALVKNSSSDFDYSWTSLTSLAGTSFSTVQAMLESDTSTWLIAVCDNYLEGDNWISFWVKSNNGGLQDNGSDVRSSVDGSLLIRMAVKEYIGTQTIVPASLTPFSFGLMVVFPSHTDMLNSTNNDYMVWGPDSDNIMRGWRSGEPSGEEGIDYVTNAAAHTWIRVF